MTASTFAALDIVPNWARLNDTIIQLVDYIPDDKLNWSPKPELWNFKGILLNICMARQNWLGGVIKDGEATPDILREAQSRDGMKQHLRLSWERVERFLSDPAKLAATYRDVYPDGEPYSLSGHWIAYHLLEHDIHHRADIFHYLALLGIETPDVGTP
jgi:uncharacterized damage-inducible protein DinB